MMAHTFIETEIPENIYSLLPFSINYTQKLQKENLIHIRDNIFLHYDKEVIVSEYGMINNYTRVLPGIIQAFNKDYIYTSDDMYLYVYEIDTISLYYMSNIFCQGHYAITNKGIHFNTEMFLKDLITMDNEFFRKLRFLFFVDKLPYPRHILEKYFYPDKILETIPDDQTPINVRFSDCEVLVRKDHLLRFYSSFINEQLKECENIFLDIKYSNFSNPDIQTLEYLNSDLAVVYIKKLFERN